jgi:hypothetical protein
MIGARLPAKRLRIQPALLVGALLLFGFGCSDDSENSQSQGAGGDPSGGESAAAGGTFADGGSTAGAGASECIAPYPEPGSPCEEPAQTCVPTEGFDCCRCLLAHSCDAPYVWSCLSSDSDCPEALPPAGESCTLPYGSPCVYCSPGATVTCRDNEWVRVADEVYCEP